MVFNAIRLRVGERIERKDTEQGALGHPNTRSS